MQVNYKSDFDFVLHLRDAYGNEIFNPGFDWAAKLYTSTPANSVTIKSSESVGWYDDNGQIHVVLNSHHLGVGKLKVEFTAYHENPIYPDGTRKVVTPFGLDVELVSGIPDDSDITMDVSSVNTPPSKQNFPQFMILQRGMISINALPGVVYKNLGYIRVPVKLKQRINHIDVDTSKVNLFQVERPCAVNGPWKGATPEDPNSKGSFSYSKEDFASGRLIGVVTHEPWDYQNGHPIYRDTAIRLKLTDECVEKYQYIMRFADGIIRAFNLPAGAQIIDPVREAPEIKREVFHGITFYDFLVRIYNLGSIEIHQKNHLKDFTRSGIEIRRRTTWSKLRIPYPNYVSGVFRIRFRATQRKKASPWTVFTALANSKVLKITPLN